MLRKKDGNRIGANLFLARSIVFPVIRLAINQDKLGLRIFILRHKNRRLELEARGNNQAKSGIVQITDFLNIIGLGRACRLEIFRLDADILARLLNTFPGTLVE